MRVKTTVSVVLLALASIFGLQACGSSSKSSAKAKAANGATLEAYDFRFDPKTLAAKAGEKVTLTFKNEGKVEHNFQRVVTERRQGRGGRQDGQRFVHARPGRQDPVLLQVPQEPRHGGNAGCERVSALG